MQSHFAPPPYIDAISAPPRPQQESKSLEERIKDLPVDIAKEARALAPEIKRVGLDQHEARVCVVLDVSASMQNPNYFFYDRTESKEQNFHTGKVQRLINQAVALASIFDDDQKVEIFPFGEVAHPPIVVEVNHRGEPGHTHYKDAAQAVYTAIKDFEGGTNYAEPIKRLRQHYFKEDGPRTVVQPCSEPPVFVLFITDGEPNRCVTEAENQFSYSSRQAIFFKFLALKGHQEDSEFRFLQRIDDGGYSNFFMDNADLVTLNQPEDLKIDALIREYRDWLNEAHNNKILTHKPIFTTSFGTEGRVGPALFKTPARLIVTPATDAPAPEPTEKRCCAIM